MTFSVDGYFRPSSPYKYLLYPIDQLIYKYTDYRMAPCDMQPMVSWTQSYINSLFSTNPSEKEVDKFIAFLEHCRHQHNAFFGIKFQDKKRNECSLFFILNQENALGGLLLVGSHFFTETDHTLIDHVAFLIHRIATLINLPTGNIATTNLLTPFGVTLGYGLSSTIDKPTDETLH